MPWEVRHLGLLLETERLIIAQARPEQLPDLLPVFLSHPGYLQLAEGTAGQPGLYDISKLQRDWQVANITPGRWLAGIYVKPQQVAVGVLDFMEENPGDGLPWVGLLMVHAEHQGRGYAREALGALLERGRRRGWTVLRAGILRQNRAGLAFARRMGFREVGGGREVGATGGAPTVILELSLSASPRSPER